MKSSLLSGIKASNYFARKQALNAKIFAIALCRSFPYHKAMKLKDWRKKKKLSQQALAEALEAYAREHYADSAKKLRQTTLGYWERGTLPRKWWLGIISEFTKGQVSAGDFVLDA